MKENFFNYRMETAPPGELAEIQVERLRRICLCAYANNKSLHDRFDKAGISPREIDSLDQLKDIPCMSKDDFRKHYPLGLCCVEKERVVEIHMSSGSTGTPVVMPYTDSDLAQWAECMARCYCMAGGMEGDVVQITPSFGLFNGGFGFYHGARLLNLFVLPTGSGNTQRQIKLARDFNTRILTGVVSYGVRFMEVLLEEGRELPGLEIGIFGAETFSESMRKKINEGLGIECYDIYGMTETGGVGTLGMDCPCHCGIHVWEDHYIVEILKPGEMEPVADGEEGELVVTSLTREALPVIRFRTGDLTRIVSRDTCDCGRTHLRIAPISGRVDDMLIVKGVNFFPRQVEQALLEIPGVLSNYQIVIEEEKGVRDVRVNVEAEEGVTGYMVEKHLKEALGFSPKGDVFKAGALPRQPGKAQRVFYEKKDD